MRNQWYKECKRRMLLDMHVDDWEPSLLSQFNVNEYFDLILKSNANALMLYTQTHTGLSFFPTKTGRMHRAFTGREDDFKKLFTKCNEAGIKIVAYYSLLYNNWAYEEHPDWRMVNAYGLTSRQTGGRYGLCCPNNPEYREFVELQIREIFDYFPHFDGMFLDMTFWPMVCHCESCRERWRREAGGEFPAVIDWKDSRWRMFQHKRTEWLTEFALFTTRIIKECDAYCSVEHQYGNSSMDFWRRGVTENIAQASDYIGTDLRGGIPTQTLFCKVWYTLTKNQPFQYMHLPQTLGRTTLRSHAQLMRFLMTVYGHHGAALFIDDIMPDGTLDRRLYERLGDAFREAEPFEACTRSGEFTYDIALWFNMDGKYDPEQHTELKSADAGNNRVPHMKALIGASNALRAAHFPYGVVTGSTRSLIHGKKAVVVSDAPNLSDEEQEDLERYLIDGGILYLSGRSALKLVEKHLALRYTGLQEESQAFFYPTMELEMFGEFGPDRPFGLIDHIPAFSGETDGEVLATLSLPYNTPNPMGMFGDNDGSLYLSKEDKRAYQFISIHEDRPYFHTKKPVFIKKQVGKGTLIWSCAPIEGYDPYPFGELFADWIGGEIGKDRLSFTAKAPGILEVIEFGDAANSRRLLTLVNQQEEKEPLPITDICLHLRSEQRPSAVTALPDGRELDFDWDGTHIHVLPGRVEVYKMLSVQYDAETEWNYA